MFVTRIFPFEATGVNSFKPSVFSVGYLASAKNCHQYESTRFSRSIFVSND
ncbi:MAG: hypothetical protein IPJ43_14515 [Saprospiraceae bacterium]|nr:hypothetical protein [Saprospiraceae bacterium]